MPTRIHLSRLTKLPVVTSDRRHIGRLVDVSATLSAETPALNRLAIGAGRRPRHVVPWSMVASRDDLGIRLTADMNDLERHEVASGTGLGDIVLEPEEVLLGRDVLDSQVVDLSGRRLSRVSDVLLADDGGTLAVVAVDLGLGALLRRLGFARLGDRMEPVLVAWHDLHLASARGHSVQLATSTDGMRHLDPLALAEVLARLGTEPAAEVLRSVGPERSAIALDASHDVHRRRLLQALSPEEAHLVIDAAPADLSRSLEAARDEPAVHGRRFRRTAGWRVHRPQTPQSSGD
jgi:sporulation protein YlmC with PRC-barrel domain